jgi:hypothetical protein
MPRVDLEEAEIRTARALALETFEKFQNIPGFYNNTVDSHLKGKLGEIAVEKYLKNISSEVNIEIDSAFRDSARDRECDIIVGPIRIEVKTWTRRFWPDLGRCIAAGQLPRLVAKADIVIWCVSETPSDSGCQIEIVGWTPTDEIHLSPRRMTGPSGGRQVDNFQIDEVDIKRIETLPRM